MPHDDEDRAERRRKPLATLGFLATIALLAGGATGTAGYGTGSPPATHAWFIGWQGSVAFAVFLHDGVSGGSSAAPVADRFLRLLSR